MKTFLINYDLRISEYMNKTKVEARTIIVEAEDERKAKETLEKYWDNLSDSHGGTNYYAMNMDVIPSISQKDVLK